MRKPAEFCGLGFINSNTFYKIQRTLVIPAIHSLYDSCIETAREEARNKDKVVLGDGRFDSPGKSAKYCTYSCQSPSTKKIIATSTIQTISGKGSAPLELVGFINCLKQLSDNSFSVDTIATDRNKQLAKWLRDERPDIKHCYDPWHFVKNIKSKLRPLAKRKNCRILNDWLKPIGNHLFWCTENCGGDADKLIEMWKSLLHHVTNRHHFKKAYPKYPMCMHKKYTRAEIRRKKWIRKDSPAYNTLESVILDKRTLSDMLHLANPFHTGNVEVYNSVVNMYAPKRCEFDLPVMDARIKLAAIDFNANINREQDVIKKSRRGSGKVGEKKWKIQIAKQSKEWVAKEVKTPKSYTFVKTLLLDVISRKESGTNIDEKSSALEGLLKSPKNIASSVMPPKEDIIYKQKLLSRFKK